MNAAFELDPRLAGDSREVGRTSLSRVLLMDDARFPWLILVPQRAGVSELFDLPSDAAHQLLDESLLLARLMTEPAMRWTLMVSAGDAPPARDPDAAQPSAAQPSAAQPGAAQPNAAQPTAAAAAPAEPHRFVKLNVASLGNIVAQLHLHHVLRTPGDAAWPGPVWGHGTRTPCGPERLDALVRAWSTQLAPLLAR